MLREGRRRRPLADAPRVSRGHLLSPPMKAMILHVALHEKSSRPLMHGMTRRLGPKLGVSHTAVARASQRAGVHPQRRERYTESPDPDSEPKAADINRVLSPSPAACG